MRKINYSHSLNSHSPISPQIILPILLNGRNVSSLLDVGAGNGHWLSAAQNIGIEDLRGVDGIELPAEDLSCEKRLIVKMYLNDVFDLGRRFDVALCLEVAEHLSQDSAKNLITSIVKHADLCFFSAAIPRQNGQGHINCQWPVYWQGIFNEFGFACYDNIRELIWDLEVEPWYKQNLFTAVKSMDAGSEKRIRALVHPEMVEHLVLPQVIRRPLFMGVMKKFFKNDLLGRPRIQKK